MALTRTKPAHTRKQIPAIVVGVVIVSAAGWFGGQYFEKTGLALAAPGNPQPVMAARPPGAVKAAAPADADPARDELIEERIATPASKPASRVAKRGRSKAGVDARACLDLATNTAIIKCAEKYR